MAGFVCDLSIDHKDPVGIDPYAFPEVFPFKFFHAHLLHERIFSLFAGINQAVLHIFHSGSTVFSPVLQCHYPGIHSEGILRYPLLKFLPFFFFKYLGVFLYLSICSPNEYCSCRQFGVDRKETGPGSLSPVSGKVFIFHGEHIICVLLKRGHGVCPCFPVAVPRFCTYGAYERLPVGTVLLP